MFKIKFTKDDEINGEPVKKGDEYSVSRSIRDAKVKADVAIEVSDTKKGK
jgi:hypothetical protein